ncbi:Fe2+-dependent dioxygenase [Dyella telluris]|uniref:Fe2+-dependent dioxygenase n=1 Tax=Dyella telluris TaxID=2763498 RepID=A0A7G8Q4A4_9GAMM|nr:Fe2+-dependent dioxygenase [Dyella telluris]QNK01612.1 Fe2+-dependent dioxygenase [Dyella telluris]
MLLHVPDVLNADELAQGRQRLAQASWNEDGAAAGHGRQLPGDSAEARELDALVSAALHRNTTFFAGALPRHISPPQFRGYRPGQSSGARVDNAIRIDRGTGDGATIRTDLLAVLFFSGPDEYDGGDMVVEDTYGSHTVRLAAGDMILYPASSLHRVEPVLRGERVEAQLWIQSLVRDEAQRRLLLELDVSIQSLAQAEAPQADVLRLTGVYHNLLRTWSET